MTQEQRRLYLIKALCAEDSRLSDIALPDGAQAQRDLLRGLMNIRMPMPASDEMLSIQDEYLAQRSAEKGIVDAMALKPTAKDPRISIWQGDITRLSVGAIVNAANSQLLGCFSPCHGCIDNAIHTFAGIQLRHRCAEIMDAQGHEEPTGCAKITPGYNLPCRYVIHTVGPIVDGALTEEHERLLVSCYTSCLELAAQYELDSIAFCCISTGVFMFPNRRAAELAVRTVTEWLDSTGSAMRVVFNVFKDEDLDIYNALLEGV